MKRGRPDIYEEKLEWMNEAEVLEWSERRFGFVKTVKPNTTHEDLQQVEQELVKHLQRCRYKYGINTPIPRIRMWLQNTKLYFIFFDKQSGKRILLGEWLINKEGYYEH